MSEIPSTKADEIERLEERIEGLREEIRRSRRLTAAGRACALVGAAWLAGMTFGFLRFFPVGLVSGIAAALGGLVLAGSSVGSTRQLETSLRRAEHERNAAIDALELTAVEKGARRHGEIARGDTL